MIPTVLVFFFAFWGHSKKKTLFGMIPQARKRWNMKIEKSEDSQDKESEDKSWSGILGELRITL